MRRCPEQPLRRAKLTMIELTPLSEDSASEAWETYQACAGDVSYYFNIAVERFAASLFEPPQVHPASFHHVAEASVIARETGRPVGWIQAGYLEGGASVPPGERDALIRGVFVEPGRQDVADRLLRHAATALARDPCRKWRAFEHNCGYTFAAGMGRGPQRMTDVVLPLKALGFQSEEDNHVYAGERLEDRPQRDDHADIDIQFLPSGWSEVDGFVRWDQFYFHEHGQTVGYATVVPVSRLTDSPTEDTLFMKGIAVSPQCQRRGIGYLIMRTVWDHYHKHGINRILLNTGSQNFVAQKFYRNIGFELTDIITSYDAEKLTMD
jgi:ribosomal protein S18 acetylase RimI-like enzyme